MLVLRSEKLVPYSEHQQRQYTASFVGVDDVPHYYYLDNNSGCGYEYYSVGNNYISTADYHWHSDPDNTGKFDDANAAAVVVYSV